MRPTSRTLRLLVGATLIIVLILAAGLVIWASERASRLSRLYDAGRRAADAGRWTEAVASFRNVMKLEPDYRDVERRLAEAFDHDMVWMPAGRYPIGNNEGRQDEQPRRLVFLDAFEIDRYEVTNSQYRRFLLATGSAAPRYWQGDRFPRGQADVPVVGVSWSDACAYCRWAGKRLPSEAEWEAACAGPHGRTYPWGDAWDPGRANVTTWPLEDLDGAWAVLAGRAEAPGIPHLLPVGWYPGGATSLGVVDMVGNASEWMADWYTWEGYEELALRNPVGLGPEWNRSVRGSAWLNPHSLPGWTMQASRCQARNSSHSHDDPRVGFRCAIGPGPTLALSGHRHEVASLPAG